MSLANPASSAWLVVQVEETWWKMHDYPFLIEIDRVQPAFDEGNQCGRGVT
jgi:hypothetical protein